MCMYTSLAWGRCRVVNLRGAVHLHVRYEGGPQTPRAAGHLGREPGSLTAHDDASTGAARAHNDASAARGGALAVVASSMR